MQAKNNDRITPSDIASSLQWIAKREGLTIGALKRRILREVAIHLGHRVPVDQRQKWFWDWSGLYCLQFLNKIGALSPVKA